MEKRRLSSSQMNIWNLKQSISNSYIANIGGTIILNGYDFDYNGWTEILNILIRNNDALRIKLVEENNEVLQFVQEFNKQNFETFDFSNMSGNEIEQTCQKWMQSEISGDLLVDFKVLKLGDKKSGIFMKASHLVCDAYSIGLMAQQVLNNYVNLSNGQPIVDEEKPSYKLFLDRETEYIGSEKYFKDKVYFDELFSTQPNSISIAPKQTDKSEASRYTKILDNEMTIKIKNFCTEHRISEAVFFETMVFSYLKLISGESDITIGSPVLNRKSHTERQIVGMFVSTNPLKVNVSDSDSFRTLANSVTSKKLELFRRQTYPYLDLQNDIYEKYGYSGKLFDVVVSYQNAKLFDSGEKLDSNTNWVFNGASTNGMIINIDDRDEKNEFVLNIDYQTDILSRDEVINIVNRFENIIVQAIENVDINISDFNILTSEDRSRYLRFNNSQFKPIDKLVVELFEEQVKINETAPALEFEGKVFTYGQLNALANALANELKELNLNGNEIIPIIGNRSFYTIISLLAVTKLGKAYFIIDDTQNPKDRIDYLLDEVKATKILKYGSRYSKEGVREFDVSRQVNWNKNNENLGYIAKKDDTFCAIHTSGSTGKPKVVVISNGAVANMAKGNEYLIENCDSLVSLISMSFDAFLEDTFLPLVNGKKLVLSNNDELMSIREGERLINIQQKCLVNLTPTRAKQFLTASETDAWKKVGTIVLGGEKINEELLNLINSKTDKPDIYNLYGPTETTVFNCCKKIVDNDVTVGKPISNFRVYVIDKNNELLPPGVIGEICVMGEGVAKGYYGRPELTAEKFFVDRNTGLRIYKTGDYGYINEKDELAFIGRIDSQIKINGLRIEIEEIEKTLNTFPSIKEAAVLVQKHKEELYLVTYYESYENIDEKLLRSYLEKTLMSYMVPQIFIKINRIPLTTSGKVDRKSLPEVNIGKLLLESYVKPETILERKICSIWSDVLKISPVGINNTFNSLGGTSKLMIDMLLRIERLIGVDINPSDFSKNPTIKDICEVLEKRRKYNDIDINEYNIDLIEAMSPNNKKDVLLTGANGFLGSHILEKLLENSDSNIYCLVRDVEKFDRALKFYFADKLNSFTNRIYLIKGDISMPNLGLVAQQYDYVAGNIGKIINSAANVSHFTSVEDSKKANVDGVYNILKLAAESGASVEHMSTVTISGIGISEQTKRDFDFSENDLDIGQDYSHDAYMLSKFKAEQLIEKFRAKGVNANVYRLGYVNNRSYDNKFQINEDTSAFKIIVDAIRDFGFVPESAENVKIQYAPVDKVAEAIVKLSNTNPHNKTFHIYDPSVSDLFSYLKSKDIKYETIPDEEFLDMVNKILEETTNKNYSIAYKYLKSFLKNPTQNDINNSFTMQKLKEAGFSYKTYEGTLNK